MKNKYRAVIVGAGRIAAGFDTPKSKSILTHAHGYLTHPGFTLAGIYDIDSSVAVAAGNKWSVPAFTDLSQMMRGVEPGVVSVCTPDESHCEILKKIIAFRPKLVICEKPLTNNVSNAKQIVSLYNKAKIPLLVNFSRRFDETVQALKTEITSNVYGKALGATGIYTKGLLHNGSHLVDLARFLFGEFQAVSPAFFVRNDYKASDKTLSTFLQFKNCPQFVLMGTDERAYSIFECDILFTKARIRFFDAGFSVMRQTATVDSRYSGYISLNTPIIKTTRLNTALLGLLENAAQHLEKGVPLFCSAADAYETQLVCHQILKKIK